MKRMSQHYESLFCRGVTDFVSAAQEMKRTNEKQCAFWPMLGRKFKPDSGFLLIGKSLNGWEDTPFVPAKTNSATAVKRLAKECRTSFEPASRCPLLWVAEQAGGKEYNTNRSAFWRVARQLTTGLLGTEKIDWPSYLCWTNLTRVSPWEGGNPPSWAWNGQWPWAADLLACELDAIKPKIAIALTGQAWFKRYAEHLGIKMRWNGRSRYVQGVGKRGNCLFIVAPHPQGNVTGRVECSHCWAG